MNKERSWMSMEVLMMNKETSEFIANMERSTNNGTSSLLMNTQVSQRKENSMNSSVFMLIETSILFHNSRKIDTSI